MTCKTGICRIGGAIGAAIILIGSISFGYFSLQDRKPTHQPPPSRDWPMFGGTPARNMVNLHEKNLPATWSFAKGQQKNVRWSVNVGTRSYGGPIVAGGRVFVANSQPNARKDDHQAVISAFRESDGNLVWQNKHDHPTAKRGWLVHSVPSTPAVDGDVLYYLTPYSQVVCAECATGRIRWQFDMGEELKVFSADASCETPPLAAPLVVGDLVFVTTGNGQAWGEDKRPPPTAPSFIALHKKTGKLAWQSNLPGANTIVGEWASPAFAKVRGIPQVIFAGGDGVIYSFVPQTGELIWKCNCLPKPAANGKTQNFFVSAPVIVGDRLYAAMGAPGTVNPDFEAYFFCLDLAKKGDVSLKSYDAKDPENKDSALIWAFGGQIESPPKKSRRWKFNGSMNSAAVHEGLVYVPEQSGYLHCLDADTGQRHWMHDLKDSISSSPLWADGRVFVASDYEIRIFAHGRTEKLLATIELDEDYGLTTPVAANGVLYVATRSKLYAIAHKE